MKTVRILLNIGTDDVRRIQLDRAYREREIVDLDDDKADVLIREGKSWETSSKNEFDAEEARNADVRSQALAAAERKAAVEDAAKDAEDTVKRARTAAANAPKGTTPTPAAKPISSRDLGTSTHDQPLSGKASTTEATPSTIGMNPHTEPQTTKKP